MVEWLTMGGKKAILGTGRTMGCENDGMSNGMDYVMEEDSIGE